MFRHIIAFLIYDWNWSWLHFILSALCDLEMFIYRLTNPELKEALQEGEDLIPDKTLYCEDCPFREFSELAYLFYGEQSSGYCHYIKKGDFSFKDATMIIWDGCKECNIKEDIDWDEEEIDVYDMSLDELWEKVEQCDINNKP